MYSDRLRAFFNDRSAIGEVEQPTFRVMRTNALCGDSVALTGRIHDGVLTDIKFCAVGCMLNQAAASALVSMVRGKACGQIKQLKLSDLLDLLNIAPGPTRQQCVALVFDALQQALIAHD